MVKIYKTYEELEEEYVGYVLSANTVWEARQPEIDQLKQHRKEQEAIIQKLNMDRYDLQKEVEQLKHEISGLNYWRR
jgi:endonuclease III-like uncharacterized protein